MLPAAITSQHYPRYALIIGTIQRMKAPTPSSTSNTEPVKVTKLSTIPATLLALLQPELC